jgi:hypothetical protein
VLYQGRAGTFRHALKCWIDVLNRLARDDEIISRHLVREVIDSILVWQRIWRPIDADADCIQLLMRLLRHVGLATASNDIQAISSRIEIAGK